MKKSLGVFSNPNRHWVGDGFPVRSLFSYSDRTDVLSPFLLLDYAGPAEFSPTTQRRGVGQHPHRGFETVTIVYQGEVEHRDSTGSGGLIGPGDVQWMTAAGGILHEEFHSAAFAEKGGALEMVQLWVNLPGKNKMAAPRYQTLLNADIPVVALADDAGIARVIAGTINGDTGNGSTGPAQTFSPINVWDLRLNAGKSARLQVPDGHTAMVIVLRGTVQVNVADIAREAQMVLLEQAGSDIVLEANNDASVLLLSGEPLNEPVVGYGPFVMTSEAEIRQAIVDFNSGKFGELLH
ncbi:Quercetin 2,3-dioxygenase [Andreprevotia sp. IGB-42]|uniref:pirin family protein n=1 Tax=Andreprevotia sp. IGB-42 TaxID=2497473 RepID=UPI00135C415D|nr:pirin family protein [Andreprevotia sp. IGB-42]KAF0811714.1 Quercetin 2,3-dioxygenase [Andreprevotia sp. IGB-42]